MKECTISVEQVRQLSQTALDPKFASMVYVSHDPSDDKNYVLKCLPNDERGCWKIPARNLTIKVNGKEHHISFDNSGNMIILK